MAVSDQEIRDFFAANPDATAEQVYQGMVQYNVSPEQLSRATGIDINRVRQEFLNQSVAQSAAGNVPDEAIRNFFAVNPNASEEQVYQAMQQFGVRPEQLARATGLDPARVTRQFGYQQALAGVTPGNATDEAIRAYMAYNPNIDPSILRAKMNEFGVTPEQFARAMGQTYQQTTAQNIPTGQAGFEQSTQEGLDQVTQTLRGAQTEARAALEPAMEEVARLYNLNIDDLRQAGTQARGDIERTFGAAGEMIQPYQQAGTTALQQELALSGALGRDAFNQAYQESPYVQFLREQGERSTLAGAAATGGLGGGRVQQELVRFGQGLASQGLQQQIQNLRSLSGQGLQAAGTGAGIQTSMGTNLASLGMNTAQNISGQRGALAGERSQYGTNLANLATSTGTNIANAQGAAARDVAQQRARAGELLAAQIGGATAGLEGYALNQGNALASLLGGYGQTGLNLQQTYTADQIAAMQNAANQQAMSAEELAARQSGLLAGQQYTPTPQTNYGQMIGNALNSAALGYQLGGGNQGQQSSGSANTVGPTLQGYGARTTIPTGQVSTGIPGYPSFNVLNPTNLASALGGTYRFYGG
jgi:hypothetical protein